MTHITPMWVLERINKLSPHVNYKHTFQETATAISSAANSAPLFPESDGPLKTASILLAIGKYESDFNPTLISDGGRAFGVWQISPPSPTMSANILLLPSSCAMIVLNLIRTSLATSGEFPWSEKHGWRQAPDKKPTRIALAEKIAQER